MRINTKATYDPHNFKKIPFLTKVGDKIFNGNFDVTEVVPKLAGIKTGEEEIRLKDYLVYRPLPKALLALGDKPKVHKDSYDMQIFYTTLYKAVLEGVDIDGEYFNPFFVLWIVGFIFEIPSYDGAGNPIDESSEIARPLYSTIDRYVFDNMWKAYKRRNYIALMSGRGIGKALSISTLLPVPTSTGVGTEIRLGDLKVGDSVFDRSGGTTKITGIRDYGILDMFSIAFKDGRESISSTGHLWEVYDYTRAKDKDKLVTVEAIELAENLKKNKEFRYKIPIAEAVEFSEKAQLIDPYLIGYLLGDGSYTAGGVRIATDDIEVIDTFQEVLGEDYSLTRDNTCNNYYIKHNGYKRQNIEGKGAYKINPFKDKMVKLGMYGKNTWTKRIPDVYKYGSKAQRLSLLQGLMDSDGHAYAVRSSAEYYSVNKDLAEDVIWLVRSLGIKAKMGYDIRAGKLRGYRVFIYTGKPIFRLKRKLDRLKPDEEVTEQILRFRYRTAIISMDLKPGTETSRCLEVDSDDHTYLANDFIVTYNSFITVCITMWYYIYHSGQEILITGTSDDITSEAWSKVRDIINFVEKELPGFKQKRSADSQKKIKASEEYYDDYGDIQERGTLNEIEKIIYADNPNSTRGRRPHFQHVEEFAAFPSHPGKGSLKNVIGQSKGSWLIQGSIKRAFVVYTGTGGSVNNADAEAIFMKPEAFNILPVIEWAPDGLNKVKTGLFIPSQLKYGGTWEHMGTPNVALAMNLMLKERSRIKEDAQAYIQELQEFPMLLEEVFLRKGTNDFDQDKIAEMIVNVKTAVKKPWQEGRLDYIIKRGKKVGVKFTERAGGDIIIIEHPQLSEEGNPFKNLYVGGVDGIDQGNNDSLVDGSKLACVIKKRIPPSGIFKSTSNLYAAYYNKRSDDVRTDYENVLKLSLYYNAKVNVEYTKIGIIAHFRLKGHFRMLMKRPSIAIGANVSGKKASALIGSPATTSVINHQDEKLVEYIDDYYTNILYLPALEQLKSYSRENRTAFDLVIAMGLAELADEDLMGKRANESETAGNDIGDFGFYIDEHGKKRWGEIPMHMNKEITSIAEEDIKERSNSGLQWVEPGDITEQ